MEESHLDSDIITTANAQSMEDTGESQGLNMLNVAQNENDGLEPSVSGETNKNRNAHRYKLTS